jgi:hypothetical protein
MTGSTDPAPRPLPPDTLTGAPLAGAWQGLADLRRLTALAGPQGPALLAQVVADLTAARDLFRQGLAARNGQMIHRAAHTLCALAGTVGAGDLAERARIIATWADAGDDRAFAQAPAILDETTGIVRQVSALLGPDRTGEAG